MCLYSSMAVLRSSTNLIFLGFPFARVFVNETVCSSLSRNDQVSSRRKASGSSILKKLLTDFISFRTWHCGLTSKCLAAVTNAFVDPKVKIIGKPWITVSNTKLTSNGVASKTTINGYPVPGIRQPILRLYTVRED